MRLLIILAFFLAVAPVATAQTQIKSVGIAFFKQGDADLPDPALCKRVTNEMERKTYIKTRCIPIRKSNLSKKTYVAVGKKTKLESVWIGSLTNGKFTSTVYSATSGDAILEINELTFQPDTLTERFAIATAPDEKKEAQEEDEKDEELEPNYSWAQLGVSTRTISASSKKSVGTTNYAMNNTPFVQLAYGRKTWFVEGFYGYARDESETLALLILSGAYRILDTESATQRSALFAGLKFHQFSATARFMGAAITEDSNRFTPFARYRIEGIPKGKLGAFAELEAGFPVIAKDQGAKDYAMSYSVGAGAGLKYIFSDGFRLEGSVAIEHWKIVDKFENALTQNDRMATLKAVFTWD